MLQVRITGSKRDVAGVLEALNASGRFVVQRVSREYDTAVRGQGRVYAQLAHAPQEAPAPVPVGEAAPQRRGWLRRGERP